MSCMKRGIQSLCVCSSDRLFVCSSVCVSAAGSGGGALQAAGGGHEAREERQRGKCGQMLSQFTENDSFLNGSSLRVVHVEANCNQCTNLFFKMVQNRHIQYEQGGVG